MLRRLERSFRRANKQQLRNAPEFLEPSVQMGPPFDFSPAIHHRDNRARL